MSEFDRMKAQKDAIIERQDKAWLHQRRGELVLQRDRLLRVIAELVVCFDSEGDWPHDAEEGANRMAGAIDSAKAALAEHNHCFPAARGADSNGANDAE